MGKPVLLQQYVKRIIAVSDAAWVAKAVLSRGKYNRVLVISNRCEKSQKRRTEIPRRFAPSE